MKPKDAAAKAPADPAGKAKASALRVALLALVEKHGAVLQRYAVRLAGDPKRGREAVRRAFVAVASVSGFDSLPVEKQTEKLYRACREAALAQLKGEERRPRTPASASPTDPVRLGLNQVQEEMLRLKLECGLGYPAIAAVLDVAPAHVSRLIHAALVQARQGGAA